ncbi:Retrovirus-related Pol polyprotein from transposon 17.6 [Sesbania bispinosa]|nr:Retrovirus-related Pol polyprotein from transposon 17.6 [Sesbania bispinosa]
MAWSESNFKWLEQIAKMTMEDEELRKLMMQHTQGTLPTDKFVVKDGMIFRRGR